MVRSECRAAVVGRTYAGKRCVRGSRQRGELDVWAIVCFAIRPGYRGRGLTRPLAQAAVEYARGHGAKAVEGYPMVPRPGQTVSWGEMHVGSRGTFASAGLHDVSHPTTRRVVMRLDLY